MLKVDDIIEVKLSTNIVDVPEDETTINEEDYKRDYSITYYQNGEFFGSGDFTLEAGCGSCGGIKDLIAEDIANMYEEIKEYEIFDVDESDYEYQTAKIRVIALNQDVSES